VRAAVAPEYLAAGEGPAEIAESLPSLLHLEEDLRAADRRPDLRARADYPLIGHQARDVRRGEPRDLRGRKAGERCA
jgi:hypothetical protein